MHSTFKAYGSPYKQWVTDSSISSADIPDGVFINGAVSGRGDGVKLDFENGRVLLDHSSSSLNVTGSFAVKDFNIYHNEINENGILKSTIDKTIITKIHKNYHYNLIFFINIF